MNSLLKISTDSLLSPPGALLLAPGGYGKTTWLQDLALTLSQKNIPFSRLDKARFQKLSLSIYLSHLCHDLGSEKVSFSEGEDVFNYLEHHAVNEPQKMFFILQDDWAFFVENSAVRDFWRQILHRQPINLRFVIASQEQKLTELGLDFSNAIAQGLSCFGVSQLKWTLEDAKGFWEYNDVPWNDEDHRLFEQCQGWPFALTLRLRVLEQKITPVQAEQLLVQAIQKHPLETFLEPNTPYFNERVQKAFFYNGAYWLQRALQAEQPTEVRAYLQRAAGLAKTAAHQVCIKTRLAHQFLQIGDWEACDKNLAQIQPLLSASNINATDLAAYYYLQGNRWRAKGNYKKAHGALDALESMVSPSVGVIAFHTRSLLLRGLIYYQQGSYKQTLTAYDQALVLAKEDANEAMILDIYSRQYFLSALQAKSETAFLPDINTLIQQVSTLSLKQQPLIYLNLIFAQLLGEQVDIATARQLLEKAKFIAETLSWQSLWPLIWDVEARLWRFLEQDTRALKLHERTLSILEPHSFAYLYAQLNQALTLLRLTSVEEAHRVLNQVIEGAKAQGAKGLLHEALALLPTPKETAIPARIEVQNNPQSLLRIETFGGLEVFVKGERVSHWPRKKSRNILVYLLLNSHQVHRESLADWLTGKDNLEQAMRSLDVHIHALRKILEPQRKGKQASQYIQYQDACYRFNWQCDYAWDAEDFDTGYQYWIKEKNAAPSEKLIKQVEATLNLYKGSFLPALDFADLWQAEREHYRQQAKSLRLWSAHYWQSKQEFERAREHLLRWLQQDPVCEEAFSLLLTQANEQQDLPQLESQGEQMELAFGTAGYTIPSSLKQQYTSAYQRLSRR